MAYVITEPCIDVMDKSCIEECPVDCIHQGMRMQYINPAECIDCGACETACPVEAITYEADIPDGQATYVRINAEFFAVPLDEQRRDHPAVEALP